MIDFARHDGLALAQLVAKGEVTPLELVDAAIARIERHNPVLNAVVYTAFDEARAAAKGPLPDGPFRGVPTLIKDLDSRVAGWPRTSGSRFACVDADAHDSELVRRFRGAGMVLVGKTNTPEFGIPGVTNSARLGPCGNPWNPEHISGGSSGGAAAAVASGMVPFAHASDGLGSIRIPAACCGLVGLKPTRGRTPLGGDDTNLVIGLTANHVVSRSVRDSAAVLDAIDAPERAVPHAAPPKPGPWLDEVGRAPGRMRIAWSLATPGGRPVDEAIAAAMARTVDNLARLGHEVFERPLELDWRAFYRAQARMSAANFSSEVAGWAKRLGREPGEDIEPLAQRGYAGGQRLTGEQAVTAMNALQVMARRLLAQFEDIDVYLTPVLGTPVPRLDAMVPPRTPDYEAFDKAQARAFPFTPPFNVTGQPSMSLPLEQSPDGLPVGMMFTARYADEGTLFRLAGQLERELPWAGRTPPIWN